MEEYERKLNTINKQVDLMSSNPGGHNPEEISKTRWNITSLKTHCHGRGANEKITQIEWHEIKGKV